MISTPRWHQRCPMYDRPRPCGQPYEEGKNCQMFKCEGCGRRVPWCFGGDTDELCTDCWVKGSVT